MKSNPPRPFSQTQTTISHKETKDLYRPSHYVRQTRSSRLSRLVRLTPLVRSSRLVRLVRSTPQTLQTP